MKVLSYLLLIICSLKVCYGVMCYWCSGVGDDRECEQHPYAVQTGPVFLNCRAHFCLSVKVIDADSGNVKSFARLCDNVPRENVCIQDSKLLTCYESCTDDLCNNGNPDPEFLPITNYASEAPKQPKENTVDGGGLKGNIFGQYAKSDKSLGPFSHLKSKGHLSAMENARKRLLTNALRGSKAGHGHSLLPESQLKQPLSVKKLEAVTQSSLNFTTVVAKYVTSSKPRATLKPKITPSANRKKTKFQPSSTAKLRSNQLTSQTTPLTTLSLPEATNDISRMLGLGNSKQSTLNDFPFSSFKPKTPRVNDIHDKTSIIKGSSRPDGKNSVTIQPHQYNTFGASNPMSTWHGLTPKQESKTKVLNVSVAHITTFKADIAPKLKSNATTQRPGNSKITQMIKPTKQDIDNSIDLKYPLKSLILPNNVANLEKPVTAIDANSYNKLHGLEEEEGPDNTFVFNSHPRNPNLPKHKHKSQHTRKKGIESPNGIVIWPMQESPKEEYVPNSLNSLFPEDKQAIIEPYRSNSTSAEPFGEAEMSTAGVSNKFSVNTPITTIGSDLTPSLVSMPSDVNQQSDSATKNPRSSETEESHTHRRSGSKTSTPSDFDSSSQLLTSSPPSEDLNDVQTTFKANESDDLPVPDEYSSFFEEDELIEYPAFENEVGSFKDSTEDAIQVAGYQDENDSSSRGSSIVLIVVIHVLSLFLSLILS